MARTRIVDVTDEATFRLLPPCADPDFDHRSCNYWEDPERGSKAARGSWLAAAGEADAQGARPTPPRNPFADGAAPSPNPFARSRAVDAPRNPFFDDLDAPADNPFVPAPRPRQAVAAGAPRKLALLGRGLAVFGSYAKVLLIDDVPAAYAQFGPLSAYPRALRLRQLYRQLPDAPLPAIITCIATTPAARGAGWARALVEAVCADLAERGFAAVEAYPEAAVRLDSTSGATPAFWLGAGFQLAVDDARFPVVRRELG